MASDHFSARELAGWGATKIGEHRDPGSSHTGAQAVVERRRDGGNELQWL
jgi:hypothetical protein